jgi:hypothetical protein
LRNSTNVKIPYEIARLCKNPRSAKTRHTLRRIYKQKLHEKQYIGAGNAPAALIKMPLNDYMKRLKEIQILINRWLLTFTQLPAHEATPLKYNASWMLQTLMPKIQIYQYYLIKDHIAEIYLPEYGLILDSCARILYSDEYQLQILPISTQQIGIQVTELLKSLKNKKIPRLENYRIMKLYRDIYMDTISFWMSENDIYQLLLMDKLDEASLRLLKLNSPIFRFHNEEITKNVA